MQERQPVRLSEFKDGASMQVVLVIIGLLGVVALGFGMFTALGYADKPLSQGQYQATLNEQPAYEEYVSEFNHEQVVLGVEMVGMGAVVFLMVGLLAWSWTYDAIKCPAGHVTRKKYSFCPECGVRVYTQEEIAPKEWAKRYGASGVH